MVGGVDPTGENSLRHLRTFLEQRVDGIILIAPHLERESGIFNALHGRIPIVSTHCLADENFSMVNTDDFPIFELGEAAARLLQDQIVQQATAPQKVMLPVHLVVRESSIHRVSA